MTDFRLGRYQDELADVKCDAVITDPPYSARTHAGQRGTRNGKLTRSLDFPSWGANDVREFCAFWDHRCRGWIAALTDDALAPLFRAEMARLGRYAFAPVPAILQGMGGRVAADGPASIAVYLMASRPREKRFLGWGSLPGYYCGPSSPRDRVVVGGKPQWLMRALVRDYSRKGQLVCDPCAGGGTTLLAAAIEGREAVGAELDPETHRKASLRLAQGWTRALFSDMGVGS